MCGTKPLRFSLLLKALILALMFLWPVMAAAEGLDDQMNISIRVRINWNKQFDRTLETGKVAVQVNGKIKLAEKEDQFLRYTPEKLNASYNFEFRRKMTDPNDECFGRIIEEERGSGGARPKLEFQAMLGQSGQMHAMQYIATSGGELNIGKLIQAASDQDGYDAYTFMLLLPGVMNTVETRHCPRHDQRNLPRSLMLQVRCKQVTPKTLQGSYQWPSSVQWTPGFSPPLEIFVGSCKGTEYRGPEKGDGPVTYQVAWHFGDIEPVAEIWREEENITDETSDVLIGRKVKLKAKILPEGLVPENGRWDLGGKVVSDYITNISEGRVVPLDKAALSEQQIEFFYIDGAFSGKEIPVKWSGKVNGKDIKAKTTMKVFRPQVQKRDIDPTRHITVGPYKKGCSLYLGKLKVADPPKGEPGMYVEHRIIMPMVDDTNHLLQYIQRMKEDMLELRSESYIRQYNAEWCLDTEYPANKRTPTPDQAEFNDTPGPEIERGSTKEIHNKDQFELYLMFKPSSNKDDPDAIWIPMERIQWDWTAGAVNANPDTRDPPCDATAFPTLYGIPPKANPTPEKWPKLPKWSCNIANNPRQLVGTTYGKDKQKWKDELQKRRSEGRRGRR